MTAATPPPPRAFDALRVRGFPMFVGTFMLTMMADNVEHVISYWVVFQKFHSAALGGFALNTVFYLPLVIWLMRAPYGRAYRGAAEGPKRAVRGVADIVETIRECAPAPSWPG